MSVAMKETEMDCGAWCLHHGVSYRKAVRAMESEQVSSAEIRDAVGQCWRLELSLMDGDGLQVFRDGQPLGRLPAQANVRLAAGAELAEDHAAAVLGVLAGATG
jgi:hypothetical protein